MPYRALSMHLMEKDDFEKSSEANQRSTLAVAVYMPAGGGGGEGAAAATLAALVSECEKKCNGVWNKESVLFRQDLQVGTPLVALAHTATK